jgi:hypothetical protein
MENWLPVVGFKTLYEVSDLGRVRSLGRVQLIGNRWGQMMQRRKGPKILKATMAAHRGFVVNLYPEGGDRKTAEVSLLVLEAFVGPRPDGLHGLHRDDDKCNNRLDNLYWGTRSQNMLDAVRNGRHWQVRKTHCKNGHEFTPENTVIRKDNGCRQCRACNLEAQRRRRERRIT